MATVAVLGGCGGEGPDKHTAAARAAAADRSVVILTLADAETLLPPYVLRSTAQQVTDLMYEPLAEVGEALNTVGDGGFEPRLAVGWTWSPDSMRLAFRLDPRARWHDGRPLVAGDVVATFRVYRDPTVGEAEGPLSLVDSVTAADARTAVFWFARRAPEQFYAAATQMRILPAHHVAGVAPAALVQAPLARAPVGTGRFRFAGRTPGERIELAANPAHPKGRPDIDRLVWLIAPDPSSAFTRLLAGEGDVFEAVRPEHLAALAAHATLRTRPYASLSYGFVQFNLAGGAGDADGGPPLFADRALRRALTASLDRRAMVRNAFDTLGVVAIGPFPRGLGAVDTLALRQIAYDPAAARRALDALGWRVGPDGVRRRGGRRLAFTLLTPASSPARTRLAVLAQEQWRRVGAAVRVEPLDFAAFSRRLSERRFDAAMAQWAVDASPSTARDFWARAAAAPGGANYGAYASAAFDGAVDSALMAPERAAARRLFTRAAQTIVDDAPAVWLFEPKPVLAVDRRLEVEGVRAYAWWAGLGGWRVRPRDGTETRAVAQAARR